MNKPIHILVSSLICAFFFAAPTANAGKPADGNDWANWRGPEHNGVSQAKGLISSWAKEDENLLWKTPIGGRSTPIVMSGHVYVLHLTGQNETRKEELACLDADSGKILWTYKMDIFLSDIPEERVGWSSPAADPETGNVYLHGVQGFLVCVDANGKVVWSHSLGEEFGKISGFGGRTFTPVIDQDIVIVGFNNSGLGDHGKPMNRLLAVDKRTGEVRWWSTPVTDVLDTNYSCPIVVVIGGQRLVIVGGGDGYIHAVKVNTGERVWDFKMGNGPVNASCVVEGDRVFASYSEENITGRIVCIDGKGQGDISKTGLIWEKEGSAVGYSSPAIHDGKLYEVENNGNMLCLETKTGNQLWKLKVGKVSKASPVWADGKIYYANVGGTFQILEPGEKEGKVLSKLDLKAADGATMDLTGSVAIAKGRIYFMTRENLYCLGKKDNKLQPISIAPLPDTGPADAKGAFVQVLPADVQIPKDGRAQFKARVFDSKGLLIGEKPATWSLTDGRLKGTLTPDGSFTPDATVVAQFGLVEAAVGELKGQARVRVMPSLPINTDFEKIPEGATPVSWVGATKVKYNVVADNGNHVLKKLFDARILHSNVFMTDPHLKNYTVTAEMKANKGEHDLPDMGIINTRYTFDLMGATQQLRIIGWVPRPSRVVKMMDYKWEPGVWYVMKSRVDYEGSKGIIRGKVWKKGESEPEKWTIELEDPQPYHEGSPGLTCYPMGEVFFDNVKVEKN